MTVAMEVGWQQVAELCPGQLNTSKSQAWSEDPQKILSLMMGKPVDLQATSASVSSGPFESDTVQLNHEQEPPLPSGWEKRLDLKSGSISFVNCSTGLSTIDDPRVLKKTGWMNRNSSPCLDLLQGTTKQQTPVPVPVPSSRNESPTSTLEEGHLDLELNLGRKTATKNPGPASKLLKGKSLDHKRTSSCSSSEELSTTGIVVTGCKSCLMYVMLSQTDPVCPRCGSYVLDASSSIPQSKKLKPHSG